MPGSEVIFDIRTPLSDGIIKQHIRSALARGLPEAIGEADTLTVIAGGPSAANAPQDGFTLALNGGIRSCPNPTYWAGCDPQAHLADFLADPPVDTLYYVASKCHPAVFSALRGREVRLWHIGDERPTNVPTACSITLTALHLFMRMGWRRFDVYGWDGCYVDGRDHAIAQPHEGVDVNVVIGDRTFKTTRTWAAEAQDAAYLLPLFKFFGAEITIHGDSMIKAICDHRSIAA